MTVREVEVGRTTEREIEPARVDRMERLFGLMKGVEVTEGARKRSTDAPIAWRSNERYLSHSDSGVILDYFFQACKTLMLEKIMERWYSG